MKNKFLLASINITAISLLTISGGIAWSQANTAQSPEITIKFRGMVGIKPFRCGENYTLGKPVTTVTPTDFRFYISDVALVDAKGKAVPLSLTQDGKWQYQNVALLDFENKSDACANGTTETRDVVVGTVPPGKYKGLQFTLGVPTNLNHEDATIAPSPLNLTSLWWSWRFGYKFLRADWKNQLSAGGVGAKHNQGDDGGIQGFPIHLGSTGCQAQGDNQKPLNCSNSNRVKFVFTNFDTKKNVVVADLQGLVTNTNLTVNQPNTPLGCMSSPNDLDCTAIMANLGIPFNGKRPSYQTFFKVR